MKKVRRAPDSQRLDKENLSDKATVPKQVTQNSLHYYNLLRFQNPLGLIKYSLNVIVYWFCIIADPQIF